MSEKQEVGMKEVMAFFYKAGYQQGRNDQRNYEGREQMMEKERVEVLVKKVREEFLSFYKVEM